MDIDFNQISSSINVHLIWNIVYDTYHCVGPQDTGGRDYRLDQGGWR